jgi:hypothetical protein
MNKRDWQEIRMKSTLVLPVLDVVQRFVGLTGADEPTTQLYLQRAGGDLAQAVSAFFTAQLKPVFPEGEPLEPEPEPDTLSDQNLESSPVETPRLRGTLAAEGGHILPLHLDYHFYIVHKVETGRHIAQSLHITLKSEGFESLVDVDREHSSGAGQDGPTASRVATPAARRLMREGMRKSANLLLVLTTDVLDSEWCHHELQEGIMAGKGVVCVHDENCKEDHSNFFDFAKDPQKAPEEFRKLVLDQVRTSNPIGCSHTAHTP